MRNMCKSLGFILIVLFTGSFVAASAQGRSDNNGKITPTVTKGYYSIYNNAAKLNASSAKETFSIRKESIASSRAFGHPGKGFYSIENKRGRTGLNDSAQYYVEVPAPTGNTAPVITKGYYSIGNNNQKLKR
jgi:hypothetical protein